MCIEEGLWLNKQLARKVVEIPENVKVRIDQNVVSVEGPLGKLERNFSHAPIAIQRGDGEVVVEAVSTDKKRMAMVGTIRSHVRNMMTGVVKGFTYKLKIVYAHFPMSIKVTDREIIIENFSGERKPRRVKRSGSVDVTLSGDDVILKGLDIEEVSQLAASIEQKTKIKKKDPRIFLDGIYVYESGEGM